MWPDTVRYARRQRISHDLVCELLFKQNYVGRHLTITAHSTEEPETYIENQLVRSTRVGKVNILELNLAPEAAFDN